jgi:hypothetical protein
MDGRLDKLFEELVHVHREGRPDDLTFPVAQALMVQDELG